MRFAFLIVGILCILFLVSTSDSNANATQIIDFSHEDLAHHADLILIGEVKSEWFDFRPFEDMLLIDTVKVKPEEWLKNNHDIDSDVEVRYYGKWAKMADDMRARGSGIAGFQPEFKVGEKVLLFLAKEEPSMYMGGGYYSFGFQGKYTINDEKNMAENHVPEKNISMDEIREIISEKKIQIQKDIDSDKVLVDRASNMSLVEMFLEKYPDAAVFVNRQNDKLSVNYKTYFDLTELSESENKEKDPFLLLNVEFNKNALIDSKFLECWNGNESKILEKPGHIRESIEGQLCFKTTSQGLENEN